MTLFTPGPWQQNGSYIYGADPHRRIIAQCCYAGRGHQQEDAANERLLLAAPELYEACKYMHQLLVDKGHGGLAGAILGENALAKAAGRHEAETAHP
jgi:hypothetical protein